MGFLPVLGWSSLPCAGGFLNPKCSVALVCSLLAVLLLAQLLVRFRAEEPLNTEGEKLTDFLEHLQKRGIQLHVVSGARNGGPCEHVCLTEDPDATWLSLQYKSRIVERIDQWPGTVWVGYAHPALDWEDTLADWGEYGCRIGNFILFGDERLLRRIQEACRQQGGR